MDGLREPPSWFTAERAGLTAAVERAHQAENWEMAWLLASAVSSLVSEREERP